jgi:hypothetical protein
MGSRWDMGSRGGIIRILFAGVCGRLTGET